MKQYFECFGTNSAIKSPSTRSSVHKLIADGRRAEHERKVAEKLIKSHAAHECMRKGLISASGGSDEIRSEYKSKDHAVANTHPFGSSNSHTVSFSPYEYKRVSLGPLNKLVSVNTSSNKSKNVSLNNKYYKSRKDIEKKEIVKSISNHQFLENKNFILRRNNRKDKSKRKRKIHQSPHETSIKYPENITSIHQFPVEDNTGSYSKDAKSKIHYNRAIREQSKEKQTVNSKMSKNKLKYKESNKQGEINSQESKKLQLKDNGNIKYISTLPLISTVGNDKGTLTKFKKTEITDNECESHVCMPGICNPKSCLNKFKNKRKTLKDVSISAKREVKSKSVSTDAYTQETSIAKRCFCILMNKKYKNIEIPEKNLNYSITDRGHLKKAELGTPYVKINKQSKDKNLICKCFTKLRLSDAGKESIIALTRKPAVYKRSQYQKNVKKKMPEAVIKAKQDLKINTYGNMETLMPYSKKKFKKSRSRMTFVGFSEPKNQELVTKVSISSPKGYEYKNIKAQKDKTSETRLNQSIRSKYKKKTKQSDSNRIEKQYISTSEMSSIPRKIVKLATPYEKLSKKSMGKNLICKCFAKFWFLNAKKESTIALKRKPAVYKRSDYQKNIKKKLFETPKNAEQDLITHNYGNIKTLMPYSKKKFKKSRSRITFGGFYGSKNQELITKASISRLKRYEYKKIKEHNETNEIRFSKLNRYDKNNNSKEQDFPTSAISKRSKLNILNKIDKHYISKTEMHSSRHKDQKHKKIKKQNTNHSGIHLSQPSGKYKKGLKRSVRNKIEKEYLSSPGMPISHPKRHKYRKINKQNGAASELLEQRNGSEYKKRKKQDVKGSKIFVGQLSNRERTKKKKGDKVATKVIINRVSLSEVTHSLQSRSKYEKRNEDNHLKSISNTSNRRQKSQSPLKTRNHNFFVNNMDTFRVSQHVPIESKSSETPVISKCLNGIAKCFRTAIFNLPLGFLKKHNRLHSYHYRNLKAEEIVLTGQRFSKKYKYEEMVKQSSQHPHSLTSTVTRPTCLCPQKIFDNSECFKTTDKENSVFNDGLSCNKIGNSSKHLDNHFKLITFKNGKYTELQSKTIREIPHIPLADVGLSENIKILKSCPCCGKDHNQPELSISGPKSVPSFCKCLYRKKSKPTLRSQDCAMCLKNNLFEVPPADFCSKKCLMSVTSDKFESENKIRKPKKLKTEVDKACPLFGVVVDSHTMKVTNKDEVYRNLKANSHSGAKKQDIERSEKKQAVPPAIDLVLNRDDTVFVNGDYLLRTLDTNRKKMNTALNMKTNTPHTMSQPCYRHLLVESQPIKAVKSDEPKSHHEYCTCCICSNIQKMRWQNHPKNCTCCICRYDCRYSVRSRTKQQKNKSKTKVEETKVKKKPGLKKNNKTLQIRNKDPGNVKLYETASQISSLVRNIRKVSGHITGFVSNIEKIFNQLRVKPCFCGLTICKKETRKLQELRRRNLKLNAPPDCVCGSKVCKLKHTKKTPYYKSKAKRKKKKAIENKKRNKRFRQAATARIKRYSKEDASMRKKIKRQDKKAMKTVEKYEDDISSWVMLAENAADVGRFTTNTTSRMITSVKRVISHPRDIKYRAMLAYTDPKGTAAKSLQDFRDSGYSGTLARVRRRCATMQISKYLISALNSHPVTKYLLHYRDKDPKQRLLKQKPMKEKRDIEGNTFFTSLRKKPCLWLYRLCPGFYPHCLSLLTFWRQFTDVFIFLLAVAVWSPCILCTEFCRAVMCCLMCAGGV
ncbi:unnamed protein product [Arctia plantaginis]|uniref:Uncharacterized protein n=1 Tax=Arctia plantaginis TaxID=874455 RepID=A0A8S1AFG7_ARCPL|nr:unnamed protein product [Arctia plantaginis]